MQIRGTRLPNGARLLCSAVGVLEREKIATVLARAGVSVAVFNYGLHYHTATNFGGMLDELFELFSSWAAGAPGRVPLFRELSAQHFPGGSWKPGAHKPPPGTPCACEPLHARDAASGLERVAANQNVEFNNMLALKANARGVGVVPFFNLTAPRHNMHRRHFCSYSNQLKVGRCCDCTHFCYTPLLWDHFFASLRNAILTQPATHAATTDARGRVPRSKRGGRMGGRGGRGGRRRNGRGRRRRGPGGPEDL